MRTNKVIFLTEVQNLKSFLTSGWGIDASILSGGLPNLNTCLERTVSVSCLAECLVDCIQVPIYIRRIRENYILSLILALKGASNSAAVLIRQTIELALKHIYFQDHLVEYSWVLESEDIKNINFQFLIDYHRRLRVFRTDGQAFDQISDTYAKCSRYVHVYREEYLEIMSPSIEPGKLKVSFGNISAMHAVIANLLLYILSAYHIHDFLKFSAAEATIIKCGMTQKTRKNLNQRIKSLSSDE